MTGSETLDVEYLIGKEQGYLLSYGVLMNKATLLFEHEKDDKAKMIRDLAMILKKTAQEIREDVHEMDPTIPLK